MDLMCRLCCSTMFVNNDIFDEENALYLKMSLYLPIKVFKNDGLPNKICDRCSCKVNDLYQFCNETIEVQSRLRAILLSNSIVEDSVDLTRVKENASPPLINHKLEQSTQTDEKAVQNETPSTDQANIIFDDKIIIKQEPITSQIKEESSNEGFDRDFSDDDDISLISLKKQKKDKVCNGVEKRSKKKKGKLKDWLIRVLPKDSGIKVLEKDETSDNQTENKELSYTDSKEFSVSIDMSNIKQEITEPVYNCCICLSTCYTRADMVQHYKSHVTETLETPPPAPAPPEKEPFRCARCNKGVTASEWSSHWMRHWTRDLRPYRCGLCEKTFRDPYQILKHGVSSHGSDSLPPPPPPPPRFLCDGCPSRFVYMRCLTAHRDLAHPELRARPLELRCPTCGRSFAHLNSLRRHLRSHSGERNFLCNVCGKALSSREHLKFHIRIHTGDKPNVCGTCGKGFVKKCNLTLHERVHSGEKPHVCSHCGKAFSQRSTLVIHERYHSGARPYVCSLCGRGFVAKGLLSMHLKSTCI